jgi:hypothetical protein
MFERYTEKARRVIFFACYEASQYGSPYIDWDGVRLLVMRQNTRASDSASEYREFAPARTLGGEVLCLWMQRIVGSQSEYAHRVLPDGCIDIVLINNEEPMVVGPWTKSFIAQFAPGTRIVGARFHPGRAMGLLGVPASELLNRICAEGFERIEGVAGEALGPATAAKKSQEQCGTVLRGALSLTAEQSAQPTAGKPPNSTLAR